ncbi:hypothetical protein LCGC14_1370270 [marine sediment metagenome]|uniref:Uncharacterized protein n=1 Tax=marine sediment metagenome TaxID=412755 RepID=A0A0F9K5P1_9ZZZZ
MGNLAGVVSYLTEAHEWTDALRSARTPADIAAVVEAWRPFSEDPEIVFPQNKTELADLQNGLADKRKQRRRWIELWGHLVLPERMLEAGIVAQQYHAPWGTALIRLAKARGW